jgi:hypothetical protein
MLLPTLVAAPLSGCAVDGPAGRIALLILLPIGFIAGLLWAMRRGRRRDDDARLRGPDFDDRR